MSYSKTTWQDLPNTSTPINKTRLNNMENGIADANGMIGVNTYSSSSTYAVGDYCVYDNKLYRCKTAIATAEAFTSSKWEQTNIIDEIETVEDKSALIVNGEGDNIILNRTSKNKFTKLVVKGNTEQGENPTTSNPQTIHNVSGELNVKVENKNLAWTGWAQDFVNRVDNVNHANLQTFDNKNCLKYQCSAGYQVYDTKYMFKINFKPNTQYTFSFKLYPTTRFGDICIEHTDGTTIEALNLTANAWNDVVLTSSPNKTIKYLRATYREGYGTIDLDTFMVLEGAFTSQTIPPYIAHQEQNLPFTFSAGQALMQGGMLTDSGVYNEKNHVVVSGSEDISIFEYGSAHVNTIMFKVQSLITNRVDMIYKCSHFPVKINNVATLNTDEPWVINDIQGSVYFCIDKNIASTVDEFKTWLNSNNVIIEYKLATPTTTAYTSAQQSQYNAIQQAYSYSEQTNISSTSTDLSANLEVEAVTYSSSDDYTINELQIGTWLGKPLYRKVIPFSPKTDANSVAIAHNISNLGIVIQCYGRFQSYSTNRLIPQIYYNLEQQYVVYPYSITSTTIDVYYGDWFKTSGNATNCYMIIEYTKTTD